MSSAPLTWISILQLLWLPFYVGAIIYVRRQNSDGSSEKSLATLAICLMIAAYIGGNVIMRVFVNYLNPASFVNFQPIYVAATSLLSMLATSILIVAVFTGRSAESSGQQPIMPASHTNRDRPDDNNPYSPPSG